MKPAADDRNLRRQRHDQQIGEEQRQKRERVLAEQPDTLPEPDIAGFRGDFDQLHEI
jgi:hypothetical protein